MQRTRLQEAHTLPKISAHGLLLTITPLIHDTPYGNVQECRLIVDVGAFLAATVLVAAFARALLAAVLTTLTHLPL